MIILAPFYNSKTPPGGKRIDLHSCFDFLHVFTDLDGLISGDGCKERDDAHHSVVVFDPPMGFQKIEMRAIHGDDK